MQWLRGKGSGMLIAARTRCDGMQDVRLSSRLYCRCRSSTGSTAERVADYHRRLGLPPTPEHVTGRDRVILAGSRTPSRRARDSRSEEHTSELQSRGHIVFRLLLDKHI